MSRRRARRFAAAALMLGIAATAWRDFRRRFPDGDVLARPRFYDRNYGRTPYARRVDRRLPPKERVAAVFAGGEVLAVPFSALRRRAAVQAQLAGTPVLVTFDRDVLSVLDRADIRTSRPVGAAAAFDRRLAGRTLSFRYARDRLVDDETGSRWEPLTGRATAGPLRGRRLPALRHDEQFWFALAAFYPHATIAR